MDFQVLKLFLNGKSEDILKVRSLLQSISPLPEVQERSQQAPANIDTEPTSNEKFQPKFGSLGMLSDEFKNSGVIITNVIHPDHLYIKLVDQDFPLYHKMQEDLQQEFVSATNKSPSYCPTRKILSTFFVDTGVRMGVQQIMQFHNLPNRYFDVKLLHF